MSETSTYWRAAVLVSLVLGGAAMAQTDESGAENSVEVGVITRQIVGGGPAASGENRWMASLQRGGHFCGGSLVADRWVLTAAHCVIGEKAAGLKVWVGGHDLRRPGQGVKAKVKKIIIHPNYNDNTLRNDIALLRLKKPVAGGIAAVTPATAQATGTHAKPGKLATVSGWGALSENGGSPKVLHKVRLPIVGNGECNAPAAYDGEVGGKQICAGLKQGGKDSCFGDSGGPLWVRVGGEDFLVGIVSWGEGCAQPRKYGVYTRVAGYLNWIDSKMSGGGSTGGGNPPSGGAGRSCRGACGGNAGSCWCDAECAELGDCCGDFKQHCDAGSEDACTARVCDLDAYCCDVEWDGLCNELAAEVC